MKVAQIYILNLDVSPGINLKGYMRVDNCRDISVDDQLISFTVRNTFLGGNNT